MSYATERRSNSSRRSGYSAPPGFQRPMLQKKEVSAAPTRSVSKPNTTQPLTCPQLLTDDVVLAEYWPLLRAHGFDSAQVLKALTSAQLHDVFRLCGIDKIGHQWYIMSRYCGVGCDSGSGADSASRPQPPSRGSESAPCDEVPEDRYHVDDTVGVDFPKASSSSSALAKVAVALQRRLQRHSPRSPSRRKSPEKPLRQHTPSDLTAPETLQSPPALQDVAAPGSDREWLSAAASDTVAPQASGLHETQEDLPSHLTRVYAVRPQPSLASLLQAPREEESASVNASSLLWQSMAAAPLRSLHDGFAYKNLVDLLGNVDVVYRESGRRQRRRSTSPPSPSSSFDWIIEAARRRIVPSNAAAGPRERLLSPFQKEFV